MKLQVRVSSLFYIIYAMHHVLEKTQTLGDSFSYNSVGSFKAISKFSYLIRLILGYDICVSCLLESTMVLVMFRVIYIYAADEPLVLTFSGN